MVSPRRRGMRLGLDLRRIAGSNLYSELRLFNSAGVELANNSGGVAPGESSTGASSYIEYQFTSGGTYYIGVSGSNNYAYNVITGLYDQGSNYQGGYALKINTLSTGSGPNNVLSNAEPLAIGASVTDSIDTSTDVEMYRINVTAGQTISFNIDKTAGSTLDSYLRIIDAQGYNVTANSNAAAPGEINGTDPYVEYTFTTAGTYFVGVSGEGNYYYNPISGSGAVSGGTGGFKLTTIDLGTQDPNDQITEASSMTIGTTVNGSLTTLIDANLYRFTVTAGQTISFNINTPAGTLDSFLRIIDAQGYNVTSNSNAAAPGETNGVDPYIEYTFTTAGTYYAGISGEGNYYYNVLTGGGKQFANSTGSYSLTTIDLGTQDPNDQISEASSIAIGTTINGSLTSLIDVNLYRFTVTAGQTISFNINTPAGTLDSFLRIIDAQGYNVTSNSNAAAPGETNGVDPYVEYTFTTGGTYYVGISGEGNYYYNVLTGGGKQFANSTGSYSLTTIDLGAQDPNDQISEAQPIGTSTTVTGSIATPIDVNLYSFNVAAGQTLSFSVHATSGSLDPYLSVFDSNGYAQTRVSAGSGTASYTFTTAGTYYIGISDSTNYSYSIITGAGDQYGKTGGYSFTIQPG